MVFIKQAHIAHAYQQINNNPTHMNAGKTISSSKELLSEANHATLNTQGSIEARGINPKLITVEMTNRSEDTGR